MSKKIDYKNLGDVKSVVTQPRIAPSNDMPPIDRSEFNMIAGSEVTSKPVVQPPVVPAATTVVEPPAPQVTPDVKTLEVSSAPQGTPSVPSDGGSAVQTSANASTDEELEIKEEELPEGIRKRFGKLSSKRREAEQKVKEAEERESAKQAQLEAKEKELSFYKEIALAPKQTAVPVKTETPVVVQKKPEPVFKDFENEEDPITAFVNARVNYIVDSKLAPVQQQLSPAAQQAQRELAAVEVKHPGYQKTVNLDNPAVKIIAENPITTLMIPASKNKHEILYFLANNLADAKRIGEMTDPIDIAIEIRKIEDKIKTPSTSSPQIVVPVTIVPPVVTKPIETTKAPIPFKAINSNGSAPLPDVTTLTTTQMMDDPRYAFLKKKRV